MSALGVAAALASTVLPVQMQFSTFSPTPLDALPSDTVTWTNTSDRTHTVTADDLAFDSGSLAAGATYSRTFPAAGTYAYHCTVHPGMTGEIDVRRVTFDPLPPLTLVPGTSVEYSGRTATPGLPVVIEHRTAAGFRTYATARPAADGAWRARLPARLGGDYRATTGGDHSEVRRLLVSDRAVHLRVTRRGISVSVTPDDPYARIALQERLRERFGWWTVRRGQLDYLSSAFFAVRRPAHVRVELLARDQWTPLAVSKVLVLRRR